MALTQIETGGIKDDAVTDAKLPANSVGNSEMKNAAVGVDELSASGTAGNTTYLRGDNTWTVPPDTNTTVGGATGVTFNDSVVVKLGTHEDGKLYSDGSGVILTSSTPTSGSSGSLQLSAAQDNPVIVNTSDSNGTVTSASFNPSTQRLYNTTSFEGNATTAGKLRIKETHAGNANYVDLTVPDDGVTSNYSITLPAAAPTVNGQALTATTAGVASWSTVDVKLDTPVITGDLEVADAGTVSHTITNYSDDVTYTFSSLSNCTIGSVNTSGVFVVTETGDHPAYTVKSETDSLGLADSNTLTKQLKTRLSAPTLSSPADGPTATNVVYTITSTNANDDKLVLDIGSSNFTYQSVSVGSGSKVGNTVELTGFTTNNPAVTIQFTAEATYSVTAKAINTGGTWGDSLSSSADSITIVNTYAVDYLVVAGGGGGGQGYAGGGGAGGLRASYNSETSGGGGSSETNLSLSPNTVYTIQVGNGGNAGQGTAADGGEDSFISGSDITNVVSAGGGRGGSRAPDRYQQAGGCGGGACDGNGPGTGTGSPGTANQGYAGGNGLVTGTNQGRYNGGGGGGTSAAGGPATDGPGTAPGGAGRASTITASSVTYGGGGGGGMGSGQGQNYPGGSGGSGGGGNGGSDGSGSAGSANLGGGGGGAGGNGYWGPDGGGAGGSGIVILRMATANYSGTTVGSPTVTTSGSDTIVKFTGDGSYTA